MSLTHSNANSSGTPLVLRLVHESTNIVNVAGNIVRKVLRSGNLDIVDKGVNDLQTKADRAVQVYICQELQKKFPQACIIGEEGENVTEDLKDLISPAVSPTDSIQPPFSDILTRKVPEELCNIPESEVVIWVDPLDGTGEFTKGLVEHVTILVGFAHEGSPIGGVIHQPFRQLEEGVLGRTLWGIPKVGFGGVTVSSPPSGKKIITTTRSHSNAGVEAALASLKPDEILRVGGAGHKAILLMEGRAHAYVFASEGCKKWDSCAPEAVLCALGGKMTDMNGKLYSYLKDVHHVNKEGILATAPGVDHEWYLHQLHAETKAGGV